MENYTVRLIDDGTLDTVISVNGAEIRYDDCSDFRDKTGAITAKGWKILKHRAIEDYQETYEQ